MCATLLHKLLWSSVVRFNIYVWWKKKCVCVCVCFMMFFKKFHKPPLKQTWMCRQAVCTSEYHVCWVPTLHTAHSNALLEQCAETGIDEINELGERHQRTMKTLKTNRTNHNEKSHTHTHTLIFSACHLALYYLFSFFFFFSFLFLFLFIFLYFAFFFRFPIINTHTRTLLWAQFFQWTHTLTFVCRPCLFLCSSFSLV